MSSKRPPSPPPEIDGFDYVSLIGSGGFSDVFLYQQRRPRRRVAMKVLLHEWTGEGQREAFDAEADLMATLSTHPSIVTMYEADVAADGRPFLAMEYCSRPNLGARYRSERLSVPDVLRIAVQISGAVETAHRAGILHRDIKPANILVTEYGHPALTDFGISSTLDDAGRAEGMSIPWSPPESFADPPGTGVGTDVWGLAATTYSLLASRTPFEVPGGPNSSADLVARIESAPVRPTGRTDVPASLERVLGTAMSKSPGSRYPTALAFARALQAVQTELSFAVTPIDLLDDRGVVHENAGGDDADGSADEDDVGTRLREVVSVDPRGPAAGVPASGARSGSSPASPATAASAGSPAVHRATPGGAELADDFGDTVHRSMATASTPVPAPAPSDGAPSGPGERSGTGRRGVVAALVVAGLVAVAAVVGLVVALQPDASAEDDAVPETAATEAVDEPGGPADNLGGLVPGVTELEGTVDGDEVVFTWTNPEPQDGDVYGWRVPEIGAETRYQSTEETEVRVPRVKGGQTCVEVVINRSGAMSVQSQLECVDD
ncbi:serine/threonine protein kinase [Isoptericola sp. CG 20/1183]|uniref:non-specific serine/threonine protein kinase n=1 Tax=Isoptericola halotolerans TaxID=300560 RepID=A0ABX5EMY9_9MICO|nr:MULTISPECIES: serine/threonine-protein kinase [Isoptericola]PRZ09718.1 serine/threonine protein kinase [Isoptericola sp. CG 20/1183]PRZ10519.1 serine/threonine protein kinase [Isoptericola halotolerans]